MNKSNENFLIVQNAIDMTRDEALRVLCAEDETIKPLAFLNIDEIKNENEADLILFHLTNHPNPVRETQVVGEVVAVIPDLGTFLEWLKTPSGIISVILFACIIIAAAYIIKA